MKKIFAFFLLAMAYLATPSTALATEITIAAGTSPTTSVYARVIDEIIGMCSSSVAPHTLKRVQANGSNVAVEMLLEKGAMMAAIQMDVGNVWLRNRRELELREVASLHAEAYQFFGLPSVSSGFLGMSTKPISSIEDLNGLTIGVTGAGKLSLDYFNFLTGLAIKSQEFASIEDAVMALKAKKVAGLMMVAGYPSPVAKSMSGVAPLGMSAATQAKLIDAKKGYAPVRMSYSNLSNAQVDSVAVRAMLVSVPFQSEELKAAARQLGKCITEKAPAAVDDPKTHPAWRTIRGNESAGLPKN